jgi:hypothetical protein
MSAKTTDEPATMIKGALERNCAEFGMEDAMIGASVIIGATLRWVLDADGPPAALKLLGEVEDALRIAIARESTAPIGRPN